MVTGVTILILAFIAVLFFNIVYHTFHGDIGPLLIGAVIFLILLGLSFIGIDVFGFWPF